MQNEQTEKQTLTILLIIKNNHKNAKKKSKKNQRKNIRKRTYPANINFIKIVYGNYFQQEMVT